MQRNSDIYDDRDSNVAAPAATDTKLLVEDIASNTVENESTFKPMSPAPQKEENNPFFTHDYSFFFGDLNYR
jgi:hypothetical protein